MGLGWLLVDKSRVILSVFMTVRRPVLMLKKMVPLPLTEAVTFQQQKEPYSGQLKFTQSLGTVEAKAVNEARIMNFYSCKYALHNTFLAQEHFLLFIMKKSAIHFCKPFKNQIVSNFFFNF